MMPTEQADQGDTRHKLAERLRSAWMQIQAGKRAVQEPDMQPIWDVINALPEVIHELDQMPEFEADGMAEKIEALTAERDGLQARVGELEGQIAAECEVSGRYGARIVELGEALIPFAEACQHLHPALPDDGVTLDGIEVRHWRQAYALLTPPAPHSDEVGS